MCAGCKGIVVVDEQLQGIKMRLRNSMKKFHVENMLEAEIEIAKAFIKPGPARLWCVLFPATDMIACA